MFDDLAYDIGQDDQPIKKDDIESWLPDLQGTDVNDYLGDFISNCLAGDIPDMATVLSSPNINNNSTSPFRESEYTLTPLKVEQMSQVNFEVCEFDEKLPSNLIEMGENVTVLSNNVPMNMKKIIFGNPLWNAERKPRTRVASATSTRPPSPMIEVLFDDKFDDLIDVENTSAAVR